MNEEEKKLEIKLIDSIVAEKNKQIAELEQRCQRAESELPILEMDEDGKITVAKCKNCARMEREKGKADCACRIADQLNNDLRGIAWTLRRLLEEAAWIVGATKEVEVKRHDDIDADDWCERVNKWEDEIRMLGITSKPKENNG